MLNCVSNLIWGLTVRRCSWSHWKYPMPYCIFLPILFIWCFILLILTLLILNWLIWFSQYFILIEIWNILIVLIYKILYNILIYGCIVKDIKSPLTSNEKINSISIIRPKIQGFCVTIALTCISTKETTELGTML